MKLIVRSEAQGEYERRHARSVMAKTSYERLQEMYSNGLISTHIWEILAKPIKQHADALAEIVSEALFADPSVEEEILDTTMRELLVSQRSVLNMLLRKKNELN